MTRPFALFVILLSALSISIYIGNSYAMYKEGAIDINAQIAEAGISGNATATSASVATNLINALETTATTSPSATTEPVCGGSQTSDYYKWYEYWNKVVESGDIAAQSSDYVLKTKIVPPVCPKCPNCPNAKTCGDASVCTTCGGFGGSGTSHAHKNRFSDFLAIYGAGYKGNGDWNGYWTTGSSNGNDHANNKDNSKGLLRDAGSGIKDLLEDTGSGIKDLIEDTGSGTTRLLRDTASGAVGLVKDTGSGAVGLAREFGTGVKDVLRTHPLQINNVQQGGAGASHSGNHSQGTYSLPNNPLGIQGIDPYSYNGALVSKGSNYIPVTSDFSSFRK
jgi:hypothetical protein